MFGLKFESFSPIRLCRNSETQFQVYEKLNLDNSDYILIVSGCEEYFSNQLEI